jgi:ADP-ribosylglycohydrolase
MEGILELFEKYNSANVHRLDEFFAHKYHTWANKYPEAGFGGQFREWMNRIDMKAYYSMGNGSAMRTAPFGYIPEEIFHVLLAARHASCATHDHPEGIRGALAVTHAVITARNQVKSKGIITDNIEGNYFYDLHRKLADIRPGYKFEVLAHKSVPEAIIAFLESTDHLSAVENALSLGGDTDTQAMIAGCIADAFYGYDTIPQSVHNLVEKSLPLEMMHVLEKFEKKFILN